MIDNPNIVWITLDSVRQDHTTMGGRDSNTTPNIQRIANMSDGVAFSSCYSHARASATSVPSILSGTYPSRHGTYFRGASSFPEELPLAAELLDHAGYHTVGVSNNGYAGSLTGVDRGFEEFVLLGATPTEILRSAGLRNVLKFVRNIRSHSVGFSTDIHAHSGAYLLTELAKNEIRRADEPLFMYVHYNEPHRAYHPPLPYLDRYSEDLPMSGAEAAKISMDVHRNLIEIIANGSDLTYDEMAALKSLYDAEIAYTDERVGALYDTVQSELDNTVVVITADHGELFGEDKMLGHQYSMHNAVLHVPMVVQGLDDLSDEGIIQHSDVICTLLAAVGAETETIQGFDLRVGGRDYAISQSPHDSLKPLLEHNAEFDTSRYHSKPFSVIQDGRFKYVQRPDEPQLFCLPNEEENLLQDYPEVARSLDSQLTEWLEKEGRPVGHGKDVHVDEATRKRLYDMGYLDHEI